MTKEKFAMYLEIQHSGVTNMFAVNTVVSLSHGILSKEDCIDIMKNYRTYKKEFSFDE